MSIEFTAFPRATEGRGASRRMRRVGKAPGIVYGGTVAPTPIELDHNALFHALRNEAFHSSILVMKLDGAAQKVLLRDVQMSTRHVVRDTLALAEQGGVQVTLLPTWYDVDTVAELERLRAELLDAPPHAARHTRAFLAASSLGHLLESR